MRSAALLLSLSLACSEDPEPDDSASGSGGVAESTGDDDAETGAGPSGGESEGGSSSSSGGGADLSCLESTPVAAATCAVIWIVAGWTARAVPVSPDAADCRDTAPYCDVDEWEISDVVAIEHDWRSGVGYVPGEEHDLGCVGEAAIVVAPDTPLPQILSLRWRASYGSDLAYLCSYTIGPTIQGTDGPPLRGGEQATICLPRPIVPTRTTDPGCCLVSGTPTAGYPSEPCE